MKQVITSIPVTILSLGVYMVLTNGNLGKGFIFILILGFLSLIKADKIVLWNKKQVI